MSRVIPPWTYTVRNGQNVVVLGDSEYTVDPSQPPVFFFVTYLEARLTRGWINAQLKKPESERHPLVGWLGDFHSFVEKYQSRGRNAEYKDILSGKAKGTLILAYDLYLLEGSRLLQDSLIRRLVESVSFQSALHELGVAATMVRAGFDIVYEDETDASRKHPEFIATHRRSHTKVAIEAKSIHRTGVLGFRDGNPPPTVETADAHKIAAQICQQVWRALPKVTDLPLYVFVDLNLPPAVAEQFGQAWMDECRRILPQIDTGFDANGVFVGKAMNLLVVTNRPMHIGDETHTGGDTLNGFLNVVEQECRFPEGLTHIGEVKAALKNYGTIPNE